MSPHHAAKIGRVILAGAGPGDPELMTVKALRAVQSADVILHDALVPFAILREARTRARLIDVGKRGGCPSTAQAFIEHLLIREARAGNVVVRLKGGDPFIFGRGGEELETLRAAGIPVEVIPGVTAASAAAAAIGAPLTHREHAHGVAFVTGHAAREDDAPDWDALVASGLTLAIYMGMSRAAEIVSRLRAAGMDADIPVVVVSHASRPEQAVLDARLDDVIERLAHASPALNPAVMLVGRSVARQAVECSGRSTVRHGAAALAG
jgi:uroporphyrin-III C-methyltransferase